MFGLEEFVDPQTRIQAVTDIDHTHPLGRGLVLLYNPVDGMRTRSPLPFGVLSGGSVGTLGSNATFGPKGLVCDGSANGGITFPQWRAVAGNAPPWDQVSFAVGFTPDAGTLSTDRWLFATQAIMGLRYGSSGTAIHAELYGGLGSTDTSGAAPVASVPNIAVVTYNRVSLKIFVNGVLGATAAATSAVNWYDYADVVPFCFGFGSVFQSNHFAGVLHWGGVWNRGLTDAEAKALSALQPPADLYYPPVTRRLYLVSAGGTSSGAGSASGTGTATGVGASTAAATGSSAGVGAATGVGRSTYAAVGSAAGTGAATGVGRGVFSSAGSAAGVGSASAVGRSTAAAVGSAAGVGTATGVGSVGGIEQGAGSAAGIGSASAIGRAIVSVVGLASGSSTVVAVGATTNPPTTWTPLEVTVYPGSIWDDGDSVWDGGEDPYDNDGAIWDATSPFVSQSASAATWTRINKPSTSWTSVTR